MPNLKDLTGKTFGRLTVLEYAGTNKFKHATWLCQCTCGSQKVVRGSNMISGETKSCGCLHKEKVAQTKHVHGKTNTRLYRIWRNMKGRCYNPNARFYKNYGGKGITICPEWLSNFESFYEWSINNGYKSDLSIDRIDSDKGYEPSNCRWETNKKQSRNISRNVRDVINDENLTLSEIAEKYKVNYNSVKGRYRNGKRGMDLIQGLKKVEV